MDNILFTNVNILDGNARGPVAGEVCVSGRPNQGNRHERRARCPGMARG